MNPKYRFFLQINEDGHFLPVSPIWGTDLALDYELEPGQRFYRAKLSGRMVFLQADYDIIMDADFDSIYFLYVEQSTDNGITFVPYHKTKFVRTDCTINIDDKRIIVQPETIDEYNEVLAGLEKEYNLIQLAPEIESMGITKRPLIQIYRPGDNVISCFFNGMSWEQDVIQPIGMAEIANYYFSLSGNPGVVKINVLGQPNEASGTYVINTFPSWDNTEKEGLFYGSNPNYYIYLKIWSPDENLARWNVICELRRHSDNVALFRYSVVLQDTLNYDFVMQPVEGTGATGTAIVNISNFTIYGRYLLDVDQIQGLPTNEIPVNDIVENNRNYRRVIGYKFDVVNITSLLSDMPTEYGKNDNGKYYLPPYSQYQEKFYPIARTTWDDFSLWFSFSPIDEVVEASGRKEYILRDSYPVSSIISVLLAQFAPNITHEATEEYSRFLYGSYDPISNTNFRLFITPKSNVINGEYQTPAQKAPSTLQQFLDMLRNCFQLYWYIDGGKFKIEHISYFKNGGAYGGSPAIGFDLTELANIRNGKKWAFATSEYTFDKIDMPERYQFKWMDNVSDIFEGVPIEIISNYVQPGNIEEINIGNFTSDIDLMLLNPAEMSVDGFALFAAINVNGQYRLPFVDVEYDGVQYSLQNGYLAMVFLQPRFWIYDLPALQARINLQVTQVAGIQRKRKQTLKFPITKVNALQLIKTYIGNGEIEKISINLSSLIAETTLKYDTE